MADIILPQRASCVGISAVVMTLAPMPFIFVVDGANSGWLLLLAAIAALSCLLCGVTLTHQARWARVFGVVAALTFFGAALGHMVDSPFAALLGGITLISAGFAIFDSRSGDNSSLARNFQHWQQARYSLVSFLAVVLGVTIIANPNQLLSNVVILASAAIAQLLFVRSIMQHKPWLLLVPALFVLGGGSCLWFCAGGGLIALGLSSSLLELLVLRSLGRGAMESHQWWKMFVDHPARILLSTFFLLSVLGTAALFLPLATSSGHIDIVDAAFTSVSAVCVTGLSVVDTGGYFSRYGQLFILVLIQLGGLGIMGLTTVALQLMGKRLSLQHERVLSSLTDTDRHGLLSALVLILKVTFIAEAVGSIILTTLFAAAGDGWGEAAWRGVFTAVSAFCNAGFSLQSDSLVAYSHQPLILHTVAVLIVAGGIAPATTVIVPRWVRRQQIPLAARLALNTTLIMLVGGTLCFLAFEWNGVLAGGGVLDKIHNAWFQSVTLRTAGFNSVDIAQVASPTFLLMLAFMFVGGSPGGTAGGIKTTTLAVLAVTFWSNISNNNEVVVSNRSIRPSTIYRAITIVGAGVVVWFIVALMLETTQQISARDIIFEATSALGTVGLSTGATAQLDGIGKIIIIITMFVGRIGPMTLFMLLSDEHHPAESRCPDAKISLT